MCFRFRPRPSSEIGARTPEWRNPLRLKPAPSAQPRFRSVFRLRSVSVPFPSVSFRPAFPFPVPRLPNPNLDTHRLNIFIFQHVQHDFGLYMLLTSMSMKDSTFDMSVLQYYICFEGTGTGQSS